VLIAPKSVNVKVRRQIKAGKRRMSSSCIDYEHENLPGHSAGEIIEAN
jgi:hypothetical protein